MEGFTHFSSWRCSNEPSIQVSEPAFHGTPSLYDTHWIPYTHEVSYMGKPALGRHGGGAGAKAVVRLDNGEHVYNKGLQTIPGGSVLLVSTPALPVRLYTCM
jgi:hypothetical protein